VEFFFRGYLLFGLFPKIGYLAIFVAAIPYVMVHFAKPPSEALGSMFAGILLGYMALRSGSIWGGFLLHWVVGMTMDALSIYFSGGFIGR
jgi:membrane protease YdiL (CAAX protease family)